MTGIARGYTGGRYGQVHYLAGGPENSPFPTLILLHQNPSSSQEYEKLAAEMARDRWVIAFDTPGYGMSDPPPTPLSMTDYAASFVDAVGAMALTGPLDVYGYHTGSLLAIELALALPDQVARIVLTGIPRYDAKRRAELAHDAINVPAATEDGATVHARSAALWNYVVGQRMPGIALATAVRAFADKNRTLDRSAWAYQGVWSYDYDRLEQVRQPTLLLQPSETLAEVSRQAVGMIANATIVDLPDLDRDIFEVGVPQLAAAMRHFLTPLPETIT